MQPPEAVASISWLGRYLTWKRQSGGTLSDDAQRRLVETLDQEMGRREEVAGTAIGLISIKTFLRTRKQTGRTMFGCLFTGAVVGGWGYCIGMEIRDTDPSKTFITEIAEGKYKFPLEDQIFCKRIVQRIEATPKPDPMSTFMRTMHVLSLDHIIRSCYIRGVLTGDPTRSVTAYGLRARSRLLVTVYSIKSSEQRLHRVVFPNRSLILPYSNTLAEARECILGNTSGPTQLWWKYCYLPESNPF
eukprot:TRINITY_DN626_c1_g1_i1.p1 TRINITY_DN626_c1_g1~~TRINITY_DN626_c1_g1_i1.p1  ORF type:complete len:245 (+),score=19.19 TRINITY_DN626_c1_g1_i1:57-791(+)